MKKMIFKNYISFSIGLDDTDSINGMCTTFLGSLMYLKLYNANPNVILIDFPYLIRHNPNIPKKTKGNGSVVIKGKISPSMISWLQSSILQLFLSYSMTHEVDTNPGLVIWYGKITSDLVEFSEKALWDVIELSELDNFLDSPQIFYYHPKAKFGLIGSLAGIGTNLNNQDHTFELLVYRHPPYSQLREGVNEEGILAVNEDLYNLFSCVDPKRNIIKIIPNGFDPVFCGIRGNEPKGILDYWLAIQPQPMPQFLLIFKTNQGTDVHLNSTQISSAVHEKFLPYRVVKITGKIHQYPEVEKGGHVRVCINDEKSDQKVVCYAYEPTKDFRKIVSSLIEGDIVELGGNLRPPSGTHSMVLNIERLKVIKLQNKEHLRNPLCPNCSKRMKSAGKNQPFRCKKCKILVEKEHGKQKINEKRNLIESETYLPTIDAQRHLTKPKKRYSNIDKHIGIMNQEELMNWLGKINLYNSSKAN